MAATTGSWDSDCLEIRAWRCTAADAGSFTTGPFPTPTIPMGHRYSNCSHYRDDYDSTLNNNSTTKVQLTNDIDLQAKPWYTAWVPGDQQISFKARRWSGGVVVAGGIYTASPVFDANGNITGLVAQPTTPAIPFPLVETAPGDFWPAFEDYSWGPRETGWFTQRSGLTTC